jgi:Raf kinase inhibitor-like YbhB/YbcL family protein
MTRRGWGATATAASLLAVALAVTGCGGGSSHPKSPGGFKNVAPASITVRSSAFGSGHAIPRAYTCSGRGTSPPLEWSAAPDGTRELVLLMRDIDAPGGNFVHWAVAGIPPSTDSVTAGQVPTGGVQGVNSTGSVGYTPPCPPRGDKPHRYLITILALASRTRLRKGFAPSVRLSGTGLASGTLVGTYAR